MRTRSVCANPQSRVSIGGGRRDALAGGRRADPVAEIRALIERVDLVQAAAAEIRAVFRGDRELECRSLLKGLHLPGQPRSRLLDRVAGMTPRHPRLKLVHRLAHGLPDGLGIVQPVGSNTDSAHGADRASVFVGQLRQVMQHR